MLYHIRGCIKADDGSVSLKQIELEADSLAEARASVSAKGYTVLAIRKAGAVWTLSLRPQFNSNAVLLFCQEMLSLLEAGMSLIEALDILQDKARDPVIRQVLQSVVGMVREGRTFSDALEHAHRVSDRPPFPGLLIATIRSAERTGQIKDALKRYLDYQQELNAVRDKVISASVYPVLLMLVGVLVIVFLMTYVVPRFSRVYADLGSEHLPLLSRWLMKWGMLINDHIGLIAGLSVTLLALLVYVLMRPEVRAWFIRRVWLLPRFGDYLRTYQLAQFVRTLSMLLNGGVPMVQAMDMTRDILRQPVLARGLQDARQAIAEGRSVSDAFAQYGLATPVGVRLLIVGERGGELGQVMERIAIFYEAEISRTIAWFSKLFEPILMIFIGFVIGGIIILMYLPIFELAGSIQ